MERDTRQVPTEGIPLDFLGPSRSSSARAAAPGRRTCGRADDGLDAARGIAAGLGLAALFWTFVAALVYLLVR